MLFFADKISCEKTYKPPWEISRIGTNKNTLQTWLVLIHSEAELER